MPMTLIGILAFVLISLCILFWVNLIMMRKAQVQTQATGSDKETETRVSEPAEEVAPDLTPHVPASNAQAPDGTEDPVEEEPVEVMEDGQRTKNGIFDRSAYPYKLNAWNVPAFAEERWKHCFSQLTDDARVLGWIAFQEDTVGASDREYESAFLDVLRQYRRSVERIRQEVGMSHIAETSIVGEEGKLWFLTAIEDTWLALFVEKNVDVRQLADSLSFAEEPVS